MAMMPGRMNQPAGRDAAGGAMQQPADIGGQLLRLGAREQHAVVERMQESAFRNPVLFLDQDAMHHRDLAGGAAEAEQCDAQPHPKCFGERNAVPVVAAGGGLIRAHRFTRAVKRVDRTPGRRTHRRVMKQG